MMEISVGRRQMAICRGIGASLLVHSDMYSLMCSGALDDDGTYVTHIISSSLIVPFKTHTHTHVFIFPSPVN